MIAITAAEEGWVNHERACQLKSRHSRDVTLAFPKLVERGYLVASGQKRGDSKDGIDAGSNQLHFEDVFLVRQFFEGIHVKLSCCHWLELSI